MECFRSFILASISVFFGAGFSAAELMEDFNAGIPADWQVIDISGSSNVLGWDVNTAIVENGNVRGNFTTGDGTAAHIDSRAFGAFGGNADVSLNSPEFTVPENGSLSFAHSFRSIDDFDFAHVEITNDGRLNLELFSHVRRFSWSLTPISLYSQCQHRSVDNN